MSKSSGASKVLIKILKIVWIPALLIAAFFIGAYVGYGFITDTPGSNIFSVETWKNFISQINSLR